MGRLTSYPAWIELTHVILNEAQRSEESLEYSKANELCMDFSLLSSLKMTWLRKFYWISYLCPLVIVLLLVGQSAGAALAQTPLTAQVDRTSLSFDEELTLTVTLSGEVITVPDLELPGLTDFVVTGKGTSTQIGITNGKITTQSIFTYQLRPLHEGSLVIPPISVTLDGQTYQTDPIPIEVVAGQAPPASPPPNAQAPANLPDQQLFVEAGVDNPEPYVGQQIIYTFKFYQATDVALNFFGRPDYRPPSFTNFWGQKVLSQPYYSTALNGRHYLVTEVHTGLFPANPGSLTISPARLIIPGDLFNADIVRETEPITLNVRSLPEGAPPNFGGAVGQFQIQSSLSAATGKVNEPLTLDVDLEGNGNVEIITEPSFPELPGWRIFNSQSSTKVEVKDEVIYGKRRFERLIVPGQPGDYTIPAIDFSYYDPQADKYRTIQTDPIPVTIQPGETESPPPLVVGPDKQPVKVVSGDIRHIKPVPMALESSGGLLLNQPLYWFFWVLPALIVAGVWIWQSRRQRLFLDTAYARSQRARRAAQKILAQAGRPGADGYAVAHHALLGYLSDKLNRPTVGLTNEELINLLKAHSLSPALVEQVQAIVTQIEAGRFGPVEETAVQTLVSGTQKLINKLEKSWGR